MKQQRVLRPHLQEQRVLWPLLRLLALLQVGPVAIQVQGILLALAFGLGIALRFGLGMALHITKSGGHFGCGTNPELDGLAPLRIQPKSSSSEEDADAAAKMARRSS